MSKKSLDMSTETDGITQFQEEKCKFRSWTSTPTGIEHLHNSFHNNLKYVHVDFDFCSKCLGVDGED